jgi:hypothetical protein
MVEQQPNIFREVSIASNVDAIGECTETCRPHGRPMPGGGGVLGQTGQGGAMSRIGPPSSSSPSSLHYEPHLLFHTFTPHTPTFIQYARRQAYSQHFKHCLPTPRHEHRTKCHECYGRTALLAGRFYRAFFLLPMISSENSKCAACQD